MDKSSREKLKNFDWLYEKYIIKNLSQREIASLLEVSQHSVRYYLNKLSIKKDKEAVEITCIKNREKTCLERYGVKSPLENKKIFNKTRKSLKENYGVNSPFESEKIRNLAEDTLLERYGTKVPYRNMDIKEKGKETCLERYGFENVFQNEEIKQKGYLTNMLKYGHKKAIGNINIKEKFKETCLNRYGVENPMMLKSTVQKGLETKTLRGTHYSSKKEIQLLNILKKLYSEVIHQYNTDKRYPFNCDFYIPEKDLFIEFQGYFTHGTEPYNGNNIPKKWLKESKHSDLYKKAVVTYTKTDPLKRKTAKENNLYFIELWDRDLKKGSEHIKQILFLYLSNFY